MRDTSLFLTTSDSIGVFNFFSLKPICAAKERVHCVKRANTIAGTHRHKRSPPLARQMREEYIRKSELLFCNRGDPLSQWRVLFATVCVTSYARINGPEHSVVYQKQLREGILDAISFIGAKSNKNHQQSTCVSRKISIVRWLCSTSCSKDGSKSRVLW